MNKNGCHNPCKTWHTNETIPSTLGTIIGRKEARGSMNMKCFNMFPVSSIY
jgi:hypothetical protein